MRASPRVCELEVFLAKIRGCGRALLNFDGWDRWGSSNASPEERSAANAEAEAATRAHTEAKAALVALVKRTRTDAPGDLETWIAIHEALLDAFLATATDETAIFVASGERKAWATVRAGTLAFVDENFYYVHVDRERYRELFGFDP